VNERNTKLVAEDQVNNSAYLFLMFCTFQSVNQSVTMSNTVERQ